MLTQTIKAKMIIAMKARDQLRVDTLRGCMAAFTNELVAKNKKPTDQLTDEEAVAVLKRLSKQRADSAEQFTKGGRPELAEKENLEKKILGEFLPKLASLEAIETVAKAKIAELHITDITSLGKLTGVVMKEFAGNADGDDVKAVLQKLFT